MKPLYCLEHLLLVMNVIRRHSLLVVVLLLAVMQSPMAQTATPDKTPDYAAQGARIVQKLAAAEYAVVEENFDAQIAKDLPQSKLSEQWEALLGYPGVRRLPCRGNDVCLSAHLR